MKSIKDDQGVTYNNPSTMDKFGIGLKKAFSAKNFSSAAEGLGSGLAEGMARDAGGDAMGDAVKAGMASGFNPYVMAGAAVLSIAKTKSENEKKEKMGKARAKAELGKGYGKRSDIYGEMAKSVSNVIGSANRQRSWKT